MNNLLSAYDATVEIIEDDVKNYTIPKIRTKLNGRFQKILRGGIKNKLVLDRIESALFLSTFTGRCLNCRKFGHKSVDCPEKELQDNNKNYKKEHKKKGSFNGKCFHCGKWGHPKSQCWDLQKKRK